MRLIESTDRPASGADAKNFVLPATFQRLLGPEDDMSVRLYRVRFEEGGRTNWHRHDAPQLLLGLGGTCVVVDRGGAELTLSEGDLVVIDPDEEHWHGAAPGTYGEHLAINTGQATTWLESSAEGQ
jgi:quercetin dioxygenase-like cupin family protein